MNTPASHLCICLTPLHVQIANRIASERGVLFDQGVYVSASDGKKQRHYLERMSEFCRKTAFLMLPEGADYKWPKHLSIWRARRRALAMLGTFGSFDSIYVPSSVSQNVYAALSAIGFGELVTYDDGLLNVLPNPPSTFVRTSWSTKAFLLASGLKYWPEKIRTEAKVHYSIYDAPNACAPTTRIGLFDDTQSSIVTELENGEARPVISIFLGPYPEADERIWGAVNATIRRITVSGYLPHPREKVKMANGVEYIETPLTAEDYVFGLKRHNPGSRIDVYGYDSAALANLAGTPGVRCCSILASAGGGDELIALFGRLGVDVA